VTTTISYAQNYEDVMLLRALAGVEKGFYIDVGAQDPVFDSVTKAFYERGWRGINIEPVDHWFQKLMADRPEDTNLQLAAWSGTGRVRLFEVAGTGRSTSDPECAQLCRAEGLKVKEHEVETRSLDSVCADLDVREVHFLKVDVEGAESEVLRGMALETIRPWIILLEATAPNSQVTTHQKWEHLLTDRGYHFAYFDGLNRFYIAAEHLELRDAFSTPPNYFDRYVRYPEWWAWQQVTELRRQLDESRLMGIPAVLRAAYRRFRLTGRDLRQGVGRMVEPPWRLLREAAVQMLRQPRIRRGSP
jgi:FkbM family methyltransferase